MPERRQVRRAVTGDRDRLSEARERGPRVVTGTLLEAGRVGSLHDVEAGADLLDHDPADRGAGRHLTLLAAGEEGDPLDPSCCSAPSAWRSSCESGALWKLRKRLSIWLRLIIATTAVTGSCQTMRHPGVEHQQQAGDDQHRGDVADEPSHRRRADSVPPSEPGPAYVIGPRTVTGASSGRGALSSRRAMSARADETPQEHAVLDRDDDREVAAGDQQNDVPEQVERAERQLRAHRRRSDRTGATRPPSSSASAPAGCSRTSGSTSHIHRCSAGITQRCSKRIRDPDRERGEAHDEQQRRRRAEAVARVVPDPGHALGAAEPDDERSQRKEREADDDGDARSAARCRCCAAARRRRRPAPGGAVSITPVTRAAHDQQRASTNGTAEASTHTTATADRVSAPARPREPVDRRDQHRQDQRQHEQPDRPGRNDLALEQDDRRRRAATWGPLSSALIVSRTLRPIAVIWSALVGSSAAGARIAGQRQRHGRDPASAERALLAQREREREVRELARHRGPGAARRGLRGERRRRPCCAASSARPAGRWTTAR